MSESIYEKVKNHSDTFDDIINALVQNRMFQLSGKEYHSILDELTIISEIDQLKQEYPETYKKYLIHFHQKYCDYKQWIDETDTTKLDKTIVISIHIVTATIYKIIKHLNGLLNPEDKTQDQPKPITPPKGHTQLNRNQTALIFWYLREKSLIAPKAENKNISKAIELMTGYSAGIMEDILKKPGSNVCNLGKDNKVNTNDFDTVISELKKLIIRIEKDRKINIDNGELN